MRKRCLCTWPEEVGRVGWVGEESPKPGLGVLAMRVQGQRKQNSDSRSWGNRQVQDKPFLSKSPLHLRSSGGSGFFLWSTLCWGLWVMGTGLLRVPSGGRYTGNAYPPTPANPECLSTYPQLLCYCQTNGRMPDAFENLPCKVRYMLISLLALGAEFWALSHASGPSWTESLWGREVLLHHVSANHLFHQKKKCKN